MDLAYTALFTVLLAVCAWITVPLTVPFTLQTFGVFAALGVLGGRRGTYAVAAYLLLGLAGLPVFSGFRGGPGVLLGPTGGYILGFLASALLYWAVTARFGSRPVSPLGSVFFLRRRGQRACRPAGASFAAGRGRNSRPGDNRVSGFHPRR